MSYDLEFGCLKRKYFFYTFQNSSNEFSSISNVQRFFYTKVVHGGQ